MIYRYYIYIINLCPVAIKWDDPLINSMFYRVTTGAQWAPGRNKASSATSARSTRSWACQPIARPFQRWSVSVWIKIEDSFFIIWKK